MRAMRVVGALVMVASVLMPGTSDVAEGSGRLRLGCAVRSRLPSFSDVRAGEYGAEYIRCMKALGLSLGRSDGSYGPDSQLTRAQMASFLVRPLGGCAKEAVPEGRGYTVYRCGPAIPTRRVIGCLYDLGIAKGTTTVTYGPGEKLKVTQISRFLVRLYEKAGNRCGLAGDGLERAVKCLATLRVIPSEGEGSSLGLVTRDQMAVYLVGLWHNMSGRGLPPRPPAKPAAGTYTTVSAGSNLSCGVRSEGTGECWGNNEFGQMDTPDGLVQVSFGRWEACVRFAPRRYRQMLGQQRGQPDKRSCRVVHFRLGGRRSYVCLAYRRDHRMLGRQRNTIRRSVLAGGTSPFRPVGITPAVCAPTVTSDAGARRITARQRNLPESSFPFRPAGSMCAVCSLAGPSSVGGTTERVRPTRPEGGSSLSRPVGSIRVVCAPTGPSHAGGGTSSAS